MRSRDSLGVAAFGLLLVCGPAAAQDTQGTGRTSAYVVDRMSYDVVGRASEDVTLASGMIATHHKLPIGSFAEVTSLASGQTILVRIVQPGPKDILSEVALSSEALANLALGADRAIRLRRVYPSEADRARLAAGLKAAQRMATPESLLSVLRQRLPASGSVSLADARQAVVSGRAPDAGLLATLPPEPPVAAPEKASGASPLAVSAQREAPRSVAAQEGSRFTLQLGSFADHANARRLAAKVSGEVVIAGRFAVVRVGRFANRGQAEQALAKLRREGYSDASIRSLR